MSDKKETSKKHLILKIISGILGFCATVYLFLVIYTNYIAPPTVIDGRSASEHFHEIHKKEKGALEITSLEKACKKLSQETRKNYKPIIGRYIENKSLARVVESTRSIPEYSSVITLEYEGKEIELHSNTMTEVEFHGHYRPLLEQVISVHNNDLNSQKYVYGVCGYKDEKNKYRHKIETLSLVKGGE